jgi:hypothetical protein
MLKKLQKLAVSAGGIASTLVAAGIVKAQDVVGTVSPGTGWADNIGNLITSVLTIVMVVAILLVLLYLIMGGIEWITSGGDKGKTESARNKITSAIIGIIILAAAYALTQLVAYILGFNGLNDALENVPQINNPAGGETNSVIPGAGR